MRLKEILLFFSILIFNLPVFGQTQNRPNIIVFYLDDLNDEELSCYGGDIPTPHIDQLAKTGVRFSHFYPSSPVCSPSRYSLLTGEYASRSKSIQKTYPLNTHAFIRWNTNIISGDYTIPGILKQHGYTTGIVGKWHNWQDGLPDLIHVPDIADPNQPQIQSKIERNYQKAVAHVKESGGFDVAEAIYGSNFSWLPLTKRLMHHNQHWITHHALEFIEENKNQPFFLYVSTTLPHSPSPLKSLANHEIRATAAGYGDEHIDAQPSYESILDRVDKSGPFDNDHEKGTYAGMLWLDDGVGAIMEKLEALNIRENTIIVLASDHGTDAKMVLNKGKVPFIVNWKNHWPEGKTEDALVSNIDIAPTIFDVTDITPPLKMQLDGMSLLPLLHEDNPSWRNSLFLEITYTRAVVTPDWKYIALRFPDTIQAKVAKAPPKTYNQEGTEISVGDINQEKVRFNADVNFPGYYDANQLYNLKKDAREQHNLADDPKHQEKLSKMKDLLREYSESLPHEFGEFTNDRNHP